jgi:hypothetical protein
LAVGLERLDLHQVSPRGFQERRAGRWLRQRFQQGPAAGRVGEFQEQDGQEFAGVRLDDVRLELVEHHRCVSCRVLPRERLGKIKRHGFSPQGLSA